MIAKTFDAVQEPVVLHEDLKTTFTGIVHPISTPDAPVHQYRGIKYASVPARFRQSKLCTHYPPQTDCSRFGPICPQPKFKSIEEELFNLTEDCIPDQALRQCEFECLNLNITCPADATPASQYPVMIWIHGGANRGSGSNWITDAGPLVQKSITAGLPVVIVSINYRLGLLGFAASPALRDDNKSAGDEGVGNYGLRDQRRAMEWVHRYIRAFGGDPTNVTLFGESTGAGDILCHLHSAANDVAPLFHRTIIQSAIVDLEVPNVHQTGWQMSKLVSPLRVQTIDELRAVDPEKLIAFAPAFHATDDGVFFRKSWTGSLVNVDETAPHQHSGDSVVVELNHHSHHLKIAPHLAHDKSRSHSRTRHAQPASHQPVIIGDCGAESLLWSLPASLWTAAGAVKRIRAICQSLNKANVLLRLYDINAYTPADELPDRLLELINDTRFAWPTDLIAASLRAERGGHGVWRYVFDQESPSRGLPHHAVDLMYIFDNVPLPSLPTLSPYDCTEPREDGFFFTPDSDDECAIAAAAKKAAAQACAVADDSDSEDDGAPGYDYDADWAMPVVDDWTYARVRNGIQERWLTFAHGRAPWRAEGVYVFGPEGEVGERSLSIFQARRRARVWREALEPLGMEVVQKLGVELCNGPPVDSRSYY